MNKQLTKITALTVVAVMTAATLAFAAPAGAAAGYSPRLSARAVAVAKVARTNATRLRPAATVKRTTAVARTTSTTAAKTTTSSTSELAQARAILSGLIAKYPILQGVTVEFGDARGYQAVAYYGRGRIVISKSHTASLTRILNHEVWHIIDWRDNGRIDWGENVPPRS